MMHRGRTFLDVMQGESDSDDEDANSTQLANSAILRGVACLIMFAAMLFVVAPSHYIDAQKRLDSQDHLSKIRNIEDDPRRRTRFFPARLQNLLAHSQVVGRHLKDVKEGKMSVEEAIHLGSLRNGVDSSGRIGIGLNNASHKTAPMTLDEVLTVLQDFLRKLNSSNLKHKHATFHGIWSGENDQTRGRCVSNMSSLERIQPTTIWFSRSSTHSIENI